jgi:hypothetical protein
MNRLAPVRVTAPRPYRISLPTGPEAAVEARRHVWAIIHAWDIPIDAYAAALLASELVTDAMRQNTDGHEAVQLMISWVDGQLRVEVHEAPRSEPALVPVDPEPDADARRGLALVRNARRRYLRFWDWPEQARQGNR